VNAADFLAEVRALHPDAQIVNDHVVFGYEIPVGAKCGTSVRVGLQPPADWPLSCPPGPHLSPRLGHPGGNVHASPLGADWEYWSRPFSGWADGERTARRYMSHIRALLVQLP
jgi:hypothetical protein